MDEQDSFPFDDDALSVGEYVQGVDEAEAASGQQEGFPDVTPIGNEDE